MTDKGDWQAVLQFWFEDIEPRQWWAAETAFDQTIRARFLPTLQRAAHGELSTWRDTPKGRLAEIIVLDQFPRNIHRDTPLAFAQDGMALVLAQEAIAADAHSALSARERVFLYLPFMHSESRAIHVRAEQLFRENGLEDNYRFELRHKAIIDRFGRYPHRNEILGRESSAEEIEFLKQKGSSF